MYGFIYITTNLINGKKYVGKRRYSYGWEFYLGSGLYLNRAVKKYGRDNFKKEIIDEAESEELLRAKEKYYIKKFNAIQDKNWYNIADGGLGGNTISGLNEQDYERFINSIRESRKNFKHTPESRKLISQNNAWKGKHLPPETRKKLSMNLKGKPLSEEHKRSLRERHADVSGGKNPRSKKVVVLDINKKEVFRFDTQKECFETLGLSKYLLTKHLKTKSFYNNLYYFETLDVKAID